MSLCTGLGRWGQGPLLFLCHLNGVDEVEIRGNVLLLHPGAKTLDVFQYSGHLKHSTSLISPDY